MLEQQAKNLIDNFNQQKDGYQQLRDLAARKKAALIKGDLKEIEIVTKTERGIILGLSRLEDERMQIQNFFAQQLEIVPTELSLNVLAQKIGGSLGAQLTEVGNQLMELLNALREENKTNTMLVEQSLEYVNFMVDLLTDIEDGPTYPNRDGGTVSARLFDQKI